MPNPLDHLSRFLSSSLRKLVGQPDNPEKLNAEIERLLEDVKKFEEQPYQNHGIVVSAKAARLFALSAKVAESSTRRLVILTWVVDHVSNIIARVSNDSFLSLLPHSDCEKRLAPKTGLRKALHKESRK
jgi:hypothetical protein